MTVAINELLESSKLKKERFSKFLKENYLDDSVADDELLHVFSNWNVMDNEITALKTENERLKDEKRALVENVSKLRQAQRNYMANRGSEALGQRVAVASLEVDLILKKAGFES